MLHLSGETGVIQGRIGGLDRISILLCKSSVELGPFEPLDWTSVWRYRIHSANVITMTIPKSECNRLTYTYICCLRVSILQTQRAVRGCAKHAKFSETCADQKTHVPFDQSLQYHKVVCCRSEMTRSSRGNRGDRGIQITLETQKLDYTFWIVRRLSLRLLPIFVPSWCLSAGSEAGSVRGQPCHVTWPGF